MSRIALGRASLPTVRVTLVASLALRVAPAHPPITWHPGWTQGRYWILRSKMMVPVIDPSTSEQVGRAWNGEHYYARFEVTKVAPWPSGGGRESPDRASARPKSE